MYLADTNLISEARQKRPDPRVLRWLTAHESELFISAVTIAELQSGISLLNDANTDKLVAHGDGISSVFHR
jgi:predicted nucleic acid-binding protein